MSARKLTQEQIKLLGLAQEGSVPTRRFAYLLDNEVGYYTPMRRDAYSRLRTLEVRGLVVSSIFLGQCRWSLTDAGRTSLQAEPTL